MRTLSGKIEGNLRLHEDLDLGGMVTGQLVVPPGVLLLLRGMAGSLVVDGGSVVLHGMVTGDVIVDDGELTVFGMVVGALIENGGVVAIDPQAMVKGPHRRPIP